MLVQILPDLYDLMVEFVQKLVTQFLTVRFFQPGARYAQETLAEGDDDPLHPGWSLHVLEEVQMVQPQVPEVGLRPQEVRLNNIELDRRGIML